MGPDESTMASTMAAAAAAGSTTRGSAWVRRRSAATSAMPRYSGNCAASRSPVLSRNMSVSTGPGMISTARMPNGATSTRRLSQNADAAAFEARYAAKNGTAAIIDDDVTVQTTAGRLLRSVGMAAAVSATV